MNTACIRRNCSLTPVFVTPIFAYSILIAVLLAGLVPGSWAGDIGESTVRSKVLNSTLEPAKFIEGEKVAGNEYVPIPYEIRLSKDNAVCQRLLAVINKDLSSSPYVKYDNAEYFLPWEPINGGHDAGGIKYAKNKQWLRKYRPPIAKGIVDIDNDGDQEFLYLITHRQAGPLARQNLYIFSEPPDVEITTAENPADQSSIFWAYVNKQREENNLAGEVVFNQPMWLTEVPEYSARDPIGFRGEVAAFYIFTHDKKNYLVADTLNYDPRSMHWYQNNPWLLLFSVSRDAKLTSTCILKRAK